MAEDRRDVEELEHDELERETGEDLREPGPEGEGEAEAPASG